MSWSWPFQCLILKVVGSLLLKEKKGRKMFLSAMYILETDKRCAVATVQTRGEHGQCS